MTKIFSLLILFALSLTWGQMGVPFTPLKSNVTLEEIKITGNSSVDKSIILGQIVLTPKEEYSMDVLKQKVRSSIKKIYGSNLFSDVSVDLSYGSDGESVILTFNVKVLPTLGKIDFKGYDEFDEDDLREDITLMDGQIFSPSDLEIEKNRILEMYKEEGYLLAEIEIKQEEDEKSGRQDVLFDINEGKEVKVRSVNIAGNVKVKAKKLKKRMETKKKSWFFGIGGEFKDEEFRGSLDSIVGYYKEHGFLDASVLSHDVKYSEDKRFIDIHIKVSEGIQYKFGKVKFIHNDILDERAMRQQIILDSGDVVNDLKLRASKFQLEGVFRNVGYLFVQVLEDRSYKDSIVNVSYKIKENSIAHINKVKIRGNTKTKDKVIRREVRIFPGDVFSQALVMRTQREVMQLNFFDAVMPNYEPVDENDVDLIIDVTEKEAGTGTFSAGAAFSQRDGLVFTLGLQIPNFLGNGQKADLNIEYGGQKQLFSIGFTEPWFLDTPTLMGGSVFWQSVDNFNYRSDGINGSEIIKSYGFKIRLGRRLTIPDDYFSVFTSYNFSVNDNGFERESDKLLQLSGLESSVSVTLTRDDKDLPVFPTDGSKYTFTYQKHGGLLGGDFNYSTFETKVQWWFPLIHKFVLGLHTEFGIMDGININQQDLYQMGGALGFNGKLRGFHTGVIGRNVIGRSFLSFISEITYPIAQNVLYGLAFFDMGNVYGSYPLTSATVGDLVRDDLGNPFNDVDFSDLNMGYGVGFRLIIPMMGRIGVDWAWHVGDHFKNGVPIAEEDWDWHFILEAPFD